jgi:Domain of unknown function (DUF4351)
MPGPNDLIEHKLLGREFKKGELTVIRRLIFERLGKIPTWADQRLANLSAAELEDLSARVLRAQSIEDLLQI